MAVWSIVPYSRVAEVLRFDAEHFQPEYQDNLSFLRDACPHPVQTLGSLSLSITGGATPLGANYPETGIPFLRVQNIMQGYLNLSDVVFIDRGVHEGELNRSRVSPGDVLLTITGMTYGKAAYVPVSLGPANINQHSVRMAFGADVLPEYVATYLNSRFGKLQSDMYVTGISRPALNYTDIRRILIPVLPREQQNQVRDLTREAELASEAAHDRYADAEALLTDALGLDGLTLPTPKTYTAPYSDLVRAERFDAGYFHPEKRAMLAHLARHGARPLGHYVRSVRDSVNPSAQDPAAPVRNFDLPDALRFYLSDDTPAVTFSDLGSTKRAMQPGDVACSRLRFYLRETAVVRTESALPVVGSSEFYVFRPVPEGGLRAEALVVLLRSRAAQTIVKWCQSGSAHPRVDESDLLSIPIPPALFGVQDQIADLLDASIALDREAARLLAEATARVEALVLAA